MRTTIVLTALFLVGSTVPSAPAQEKPGPTVEIRLKSINDLLDYFEYVGGLAGQEEQARQAAGFVRAIAGDKGIEGVDPKRPIGLYASITKDVADSPVVAMIPVADEEAILSLLRDRLSLDPKKGDDGVYAVDVPNVPGTVYFTFANKYAYITLREKKPLARESLASPAAFFPKDDPAVATVAVHIDRIPDDVRKYAFSQLELQLSKEKEKKETNQTAAQHKLKGLSLDTLAAAASAVITGGKDLTVRLLVNPKDDELTLDVNLTAAAGSDLGKALRAVASRKALAPAAAAAKNPVVAGSVNFGLPAAMVEKLGPVIDEIIKDAVESAKPEDKDAASRVLDVLAPTLKSGEAELGGAMTGPDDAGHYKVVLALRVKDGTGIENLSREFAPFVADKVTAEFDAAKVAGRPLHKFVVSNADVKKLYGTETVWWAIDDGISILSFEPDGAEAKRVAAATPASTEIIRLEASAAAAAAAFDKQIKPDDLKRIIDETFDGKPPQGRDTLRLVVTGGDRLTAKVTVKGRAVRLLAAIDQAKKKDE